MGATSGTDFFGSTAGAGAVLGTATLAGGLILLAGLTGVTLSLVESAPTALVERLKNTMPMATMISVFRYIELPPDQAHPIR
nr:hypothetical protein 3 [Desulfobulbaceae bacterium]